MSVDRSVPRVLDAIGRSIQGMEELAVEKISEASRHDPFRVLIATMLSAISPMRRAEYASDFERTFHANAPALP